MAEENEDFVRTSVTEAGYWYSFNYTNIHEYKQTCDSTPLVYLLDVQNPKNCVFGINIHKMAPQDRQALVDLMLEQIGDQEGESVDESAWPFNYDWFVSYFRDYVKGEHSALRFYNMKNIREPYRVKNKSIKKYAMTEGHIIGENPQYQEIQHDLERNENA